jgi:DNA-binding XRE family transcriptional regulator
MPIYATMLLGGGYVAKNLRIKVVRAAKDMSQKDLAKTVGVARQTMNAIEKGDYCITPSVPIQHLPKHFFA